MKWPEAKQKLLDMANGRACSITYEQLLFSDKTTRPACAVYIEDVARVTRSTWSEALMGLRGAIDGSDMIDYSEAPD